MKHTAIPFCFFQIMVLAVVACFIPKGAAAQDKPDSQSLKGKIIDQNEGGPLIGANIRLINPKDSTLIRGTVTDFTGKFSLKAPQDSAIMAITFLGYQPLFLWAAPQSKDHGTIQLMEDNEMLEGVDVEGKRVTAIIKGDTIQYSAKDYKTNQYANTEDLVRKMPGVVKDGASIKAQGEEVKRVTVDGKPFFGQDPNAALKNLPAQMVDKVQVHDRKSDQAQMTGVDDGETEKAINITTKEEYKRAVFGKGFASYGTQDRYHGSMNVNFFNKDQRISLLGMANNINVQNFSDQSLATATGSGDEERWRRRRRMRRGGFNNSGEISDFLVDAQLGITESQAFGLNYSDFWGDEFEANGSYFFNHSDNEQETNVRRTYFLGDTSNQFYRESSEQTTQNLVNRANFRLNYHINDKTTLLLLPSVSTQDSRQWYESQASTTNEQGDSISTTRSDIFQEGSGYNFNNNMIFRRKLKTKGSNIVGSLETNIEEQRGTGRVDNLTRSLTNGQQTRQFIQEQDNVNSKIKLESEWEFTQRVSDLIRLQLDVEGEYEQNYNRRDVEQKDAGEEVLTFRRTLSNNFTADMYRNSVGFEFLMESDKFYYRLSPEFQRVNLIVNRRYPSSQPLEKLFLNFTPSTNLRWKISPEANIRSYLGARTSTPSADELQEAVNNSNPLLQSSGNPDLRQEYISAFVVRSSFNRLKTGTNFNFFIYARNTRDKISTSTVIAQQDTTLSNGVELQEGAQFSRPVNLNGYYRVQSELSAGKPIKKINLNIGLNGGYFISPSLLNGQRNDSRNYNIGLKLSATSNISEQLDFNLSIEGKQNDIRYERTPSLNNEFYSISSNNILSWVFWKGFVVRQGLNYTQFIGLDDDGVDNNVFLWNMSLGKRMLEKENLELSLEVFDVLNQNNGLSRELTETYTEAVETRMLRRYFMLKLTYNLQPISLMRQEELDRLRQNRP